MCIVSEINLGLNIEHFSIIPLKYMDIDLIMLG